MIDAHSAVANEILDKYCKLIVFGEYAEEFMGLTSGMG